MWWPIIGIFATFAGLVMFRKDRPKQLPSAQTVLSPDQVLNLATQVKTWELNPGAPNGKTVELFTHLGAVNATRVATMAMSLGGDPSNINAALYQAQS